jgi:hypothetical protein
LSRRVWGTVGLAGVVGSWVKASDESNVISNKAASRKSFIGSLFRNTIVIFVGKLLWKVRAHFPDLMIAISKRRASSKQRINLQHATPKVVIKMQLLRN